jgi:tetratricopeptide (TPR) repeat protein
VSALWLAPLLVGAVPPGLSSDEVARRAEEEFDRGVQLQRDAARARPHFRAAAEHFEELRRRGARNPLLYRNLGNAYLLAGELPQAILAYRRGLRLAPRDAALRENLTRARALVAYPQESNFARPVPDIRPPWLPGIGPRWLFAAAVALYGLAWVQLTRWLMVRRRRLLVLGLAGLVSAGLLTAVLVVLQRSEKVETHHPLVVIADDDVLLRKGNGAAFPPSHATPVNRGVEARLLFARGDWLQIELSGGEVGWIPRRAALVDEGER